MTHLGGGGGGSGGGGGQGSCRQCTYTHRRHSTHLLQDQVLHAGIKDVSKLLEDFLTHRYRTANLALLLPRWRWWGRWWRWWGRARVTLIVLCRQHSACVNAQVICQAEIQTAVSCGAAGIMCTYSGYVLAQGPCYCMQIAQSLHSATCGQLCLRSAPYLHQPLVCCW